MDSYLPKSYPSLMEGKKILYVHGFLSAGSTHTADVLRQFMPRATVLAPDLPVHPADAMALLKETVESERPDLIIGTSMGGMYTEMLYGFDRICVNPAFEMGATMSEHQMMGKQTFQNPRQDGVQEIIVTKALVKEYREMTEHCFSQVTAEEQQRVFGLFGDEDPIVHTYDLFLQHYPQAIHFHGEHRLVEKAIYHYIIPIVRRIDDRQTGATAPPCSSTGTRWPTPTANRNRVSTKPTNNCWSTTTSTLSYQPPPATPTNCHRSRPGSSASSVHQPGTASSSPTTCSSSIATTSFPRPKRPISSVLPCASAATS